VARGLLREFGVVEGIDCFSFPDAGFWRVDTLSFQACKITDLILKRPETASFPIFARFSDNRVTGDAICEFSDGTPAITIEDEVLKFGFDPFTMHLASLNEGYCSARANGLTQSALVMYSYLPPPLRKSVRRIARRYKTSHIRSIRDIELFGVSSNVIIHLMEQHLIERGLLDNHHRPPLAIVTHDIDTHFCQTEGREIVSSIDKDERVHATWFFVPRSVQYSLDRRGVRSLIEEGHEIGMHGYAHDGRLALGNPAKLSKQLCRGKSILESIGTKVVSFRSPWTLRSSQLLMSLASEGFKVDSSFPDVDTSGMTGERKGLSYNRPFRPMVAKVKSPVKLLPLWEVPMTGPQDVQMAEDLRLTGSDMLKVWNRKAEFCKDFKGVFVLHTHPCCIVKYLDYYVGILKSLKRGGFHLMRMDSLVQDFQSKLPD